MSAPQGDAAAGREEIAGFPERIVLELTPLCNLSCSMCPRHHAGDRDGFMEGVLWRKLVDEIAKESPESIILPFWRGESLLHPEYAAFMEYALAKGMRVHMCTNGQILGSFADVLSRIEFVTFSIHTPIGFSNAFEFLKFKRNGRPTIQVSFVEGEPSAGWVNEVVSGPGLSGFDSVRLYKEHTMDGVFGSSGGAGGAGRAFCGKLKGTLVIAYDGTVSRCNHVWETEERLNAARTSIAEIWRSGRFNEIRREYPDKFCAPCGQWTGHTRGESWRMVEGKVVHQKFD